MTDKLMSKKYYLISFNSVWVVLSGTSELIPFFYLSMEKPKGRVIDLAVYLCLYGPL